PDVESVAKTLSVPPALVPPISPSKTSGAYRRRRAFKGTPSWIHALPAVLLFLAVLTAVLVDHWLPKPASLTSRDEDIKEQEGQWTYNVKDPDPLLTVRFNENMRFGLEMAKEKDPNYPDKYKRLTYDEHGKSNNTIIKIDNFEHVFGVTTPNNRWADRGRGKKKPIPGRNGWTSTMEFTSEKVEVTQHVEIVPGQSGYLDTLLVYYTIRNKDDGKRKVGIRVMLDTFIGANDGVPFTIPGKKGFVDTKADFVGEQVPDYIEVIEKPNDPEDPGTVARMGLRHMRLPGGITLEDMDKLRICRFPGPNARWDWPVQSMKGGKGETADSCVALYWPYEY